MEQTFLKVCRRSTKEEEEEVASTRKKFLLLSKICQPFKIDILFFCWRWHHHGGDNGVGCRGRGGDDGVGGADEECGGRTLLEYKWAKYEA